MKDAPTDTLDQSPKEDRAGVATLTPSEVEGILYTQVDSVEVLTHQKPDELESSDGVVSVDQAVVSRDRAKKYNKPISPDFQIAVVRLQHRSTGNDPATDTVRLEVPLANRDDLKLPGKHTKEHDSEVFVFNPDGSVREGYRQTTKIYYKHANHPKGNSSTEVVRVAEIKDDELASRARIRITDLHACVDAGI